MLAILNPFTLNYKKVVLKETTFLPLNRIITPFL